MSYRCIIFGALIPPSVVSGNRLNFCIKEAESPEEAMREAGNRVFKAPYRCQITWQLSSGIVFIDGCAIGTVFLVTPGL